LLTHRQTKTGKNITSLAPIRMHGTAKKLMLFVTLPLQCCQHCRDCSLSAVQYNL